MDLKKEEKMTPYEEMKKLQDDAGIKKIVDLLVLAPQNDPFYMGQQGQVDKAKWFADIWHTLGFTSNVHIRRIHYRMVSQPTPIIKPNGKPYKNTISDYGFLNEASKSARYIEDSISPSDFVDRRNAEPMINDITDMELPEVIIQGRYHMMNEIPMPALPKITTDNGGYYIDVPDQYMVEIWSEKSTMNDIIIPVAQNMNANYVYGMGELSLTLVDDLINRIIERDKPTRIFYISDFDPAGLIMPVSISRKIEFLGGDLDIKLFPLMLTEQQCIDHTLPRTPIKDTDLRKAGFENNYGGGATELDALEALYPGEFEKILVDAISEYRQPDFVMEVQEAVLKYENMVEDANEDVYKKYEEEVAQVKEEWQAIQQTVEAWKESFEPVYDNILTDLEEVEVDEIVIPKPATIANHTNPLFSTDRDYMEQLVEYKFFQKKEVALQVLEAIA